MKPSYKKVMKSWVTIKESYHEFISNWGFPENEHTLKLFCLQVDSWFLLGEIDKKLKETNHDE